MVNRAQVPALDGASLLAGVSHVGQQTTADVIAASRVSIIASHAAVAAVQNTSRGLTDAA